MSIPGSTDGDGGFRRSLLRNSVGAVALVLGSALVFGGIGMIGRADAPDIVVADDAPGAGNDTAGGPELDSAADENVGDATDDDSDESGPDGDTEPSDGDASVDVDDEDADEPESPEAGTDDPGDEESGSDGGDDADPQDDAEEPDGESAEADDVSDEADAAEEAEETASIDPASIDLQVLDGYQQDGGTAAAQVADELRAAGYRVIAENPALRYDVTTVLWSPGGEAQARQVAAEIGAPEVREQPGTLSNSVAVHVVVGSDRG